MARKKKTSEKGRSEKETEPTINSFDTHKEKHSKRQYGRYLSKLKKKLYEVHS